MREDFERGHAEREFDSALLQLLVAEQRAMHTRVLVLDVSGRVLFIGLVVCGAFAARLSALEMGAALVASCLLAAAWFWSRRTAGLRSYRITQALSNYARGSPAQHAYAESRFSVEFRSPFDALVRFEPVLWLALAAIVLIGGLFVD